MISPPTRREGGYDDGFAGAPDGYPWQTWGIGLVVALLVGGYGAIGLWRRQVTFVGQHASEQLVGPRAVAISVAYLGVGVLLFCHYFIQNWRPLAWYAVLGKVAGLLMIIGGLGYYGVRWVTG